MSVLAKIFNPRNDATLANPVQQWLVDAFGGSKTSSGERINTETVLGIIAYFACIRNISEDQGKLPRKVFKNTKPRGKEQADDHPAYKLIHDQPNEEMTSITFHETLTSHALGWKGGFAEIVRNGSGQPKAMYPLDPNTVTVQRNDAKQIRYLIRVSGVPDVTLRPEQVLHIHGLGFDGTTGYLLSWLARESLGSVLAARNFGASFFGNGTTATGMLKVPGTLSDPALKNLRDSWAERYSGGKENAHKAILLEEGMDWVPVSTEPQKSQMLETMEFNIEEVCRLFRIAPQKVGHFKRAQGWSTLEMTNTDYVNDTLMPWLVRWEEEYKRKLFSPKESEYFVKHNVGALLRGDATARSTYYKSQWGIGALSQNDIRELEDMNPIGPEGDTYYVPLNMVPSEIAAQGPQQTPPNTPNQPVEPDQTDDSTPNQSAIRALGKAHQALLADAFARLLNVEARWAKQGKLKEKISADHVHLSIAGVIDAFVDAAMLFLGVKSIVEQQKEAVLQWTKGVAALHVKASIEEMTMPELVAEWTSGARSQRIAVARMDELVGLVLQLNGAKNAS